MGGQFWSGKLGGGGHGSIRLLSACSKLGIGSRDRVKRLLQKGRAALRRGGVREIMTQLGAYIARYSEVLTYDEWVRLNDSLSGEDHQAIRLHVDALSYKPMVSLIMPACDAPQGWLRSSLDSIVSQLYPHWELCVANIASSVSRVREVLEEYGGQDSRIKIAFKERNAESAEALNDALSLVSGEFVALLDRDDVLAKHALYMVAEELNRHPDTDLVYSDADNLDVHQRRYHPYFKPDWSPDLLCSHDFLNHLGVYRTALVRQVGGFRRGYEGSQDYDLAFRATERITGSRIRHIPHVLCHRRVAPGSAADGAVTQLRARESAARAIGSHFERLGIPVEVLDGPSGFHRVRYRLPDSLPLVSLIIPTKNHVGLLSTCLSGILEKTDYPNLEVLIVDNESRDRKALAYLDDLQRGPRVRVMQYRGAFNFSAINNLAARNTRGELLGLVNSDLEVISPGWLREMVSHAVRPEVGAVGAMLYYPNDRIQHAGVILGIGGVAGHAHKWQKRGKLGYAGRAAVIQNFSAVTAACAVMRRVVFEEVGGFDERNLAVAYNDVDLCLRIREHGYLIVWTPFAELYHREAASRGPDQRPRFDREIRYMQLRWGPLLANDPYYHPNLTLRREDFSLADAPGARKPWKERVEDRVHVPLHP